MTNQTNKELFEPIPIPQSKENLVLSVRDLLNSSGLQLECNSAFIGISEIAEVMMAHHSIQRPVLNMFFLHQLVPYGSESMEERYCLVNDGTPEEWLRLFKAKILPFFIAKRLPVITH